MKKKFQEIYQFKIALKDIKPPIWRRIQVPETYSFWDLHCAIQDAMGWEDYHLHKFVVLNPTVGKKVIIGIPDEEYDRNDLPGWDHKIAGYFSMKNNSALYMYDFGDGWEHTIKLEKILPRDKDTEYPLCIAGERACPPEDCGGIGGYEDFLEAIQDPEHERHEELLEWIGGEFDPEFFDPQEVSFDDPDECWKFSFK